MGLHEWILVGLAVVASVVVIVEVQKSKRSKPDEPDWEEAVAAASAAVPGPVADRWRSVVLVGHNPVTRLSLKRALEERHSVAEARDAQEGLQRLVELSDPGTEVVAVVDLAPGQGSVSEFTAAVDSDDRTKNTRILVLLAEGDERPSGTPDSAGVEYMTKPIPGDILLARIQASPD